MNSTDRISTEIKLNGRRASCFGPFRYDWEQRLLFREGETVPLAPKVGETLRVLLERHGTMVEKAELMRAVWPDTRVEEIGLARNISQLRKALGDENDAGRYIETLPKRGYRFVGEVVMEGVVDGGQERAKANVAWMRRLRGILLMGVGLCAVLAVVYWQFYRPSRYLSSGDGIANIAVIPFECLSPELDCGAFPHGLNDLLVADLTKMDGCMCCLPRRCIRISERGCRCHLWPDCWGWT